MVDREIREFTALIERAREIRNEVARRRDDSSLEPEPTDEE